MNRRRFGALAAASLTASVLGSQSASAMRPGPSTSTDAIPGVTQFVTDLLANLSTDGGAWESMFTERGIRDVPEVTSEGSLIAVASVSPDLNGDLNAYVVISGLRQDGGLYYDRIFLKVADGTYKVDQWENRLPTFDEG